METKIGSVVAGDCKLREGTKCRGIGESFGENKVFYILFVVVGI